MSTFDRNVLVVLLDGCRRAELRRAVARRSPEPQRVRVVVPARLGTLEWLTSDEDAARAGAERRAEQAEWALSDQGRIEIEAGEPDPVQAVEDALRTFSPSEILVVGAPDDGALQLSLEEFGIPVRRVGGTGPPEPGDEVRRDATRVARGRSQSSPFVLLAGVNLAVLAVVALIVLLVVVAIWIF